MQDQQVIGDVKHYAFNDQETGRNIGNVKLGKRAMRETDLLAFEIAVTEGQPGMVMCSYNKLNGDWACENSYLLNDVLKKAWGFQGFVLSDWGGDAQHREGRAGRARQRRAGWHAISAMRSRRRWKSGEVPMARLDDMVHRILRTEFASGIVDDPPLGRVVDPFHGADTAQTMAEQASVLLKNANSQLPLNAAADQVDSVDRLARGYRHAFRRRIGAGRSSRAADPADSVDLPIWFPTSPLKAIRAKARESQSGVSTTAAIRRRRCARPRLPKSPSFSSISPPAKDAIFATLTLPGRPGRTGERGGCGQSAYHRRAGNRRSGGHAVDWPSERRDRGLVSRNPRRRGAG